MGMGNRFGPEIKESVACRNRLEVGYLKISIITCLGLLNDKTTSYGTTQNH